MKSGSYLLGVACLSALGVGCVAQPEPAGDAFMQSAEELIGEKTVTLSSTSKLKNGAMVAMSGRVKAYCPVRLAGGTEVSQRYNAAWIEFRNTTGADALVNVVISLPGYGGSASVATYASKLDAMSAPSDHEAFAEFYTFADVTRSLSADASGAYVVATSRAFGARGMLTDESGTAMVVGANSSTWMLVGAASFSGAMNFTYEVSYLP